LRAELHKLSQQAVLLPGEERPRRLSVTTLERWFYALRKYGLAGLRPKRKPPAEYTSVGDSVLS
jgi:putative transposase